MTQKNTFNYVKIFISISSRVGYVKFYCALCLIILYTNLSSQIIVGKITNSTNQAISQATVKLTNTNTFTSTDRDGKFIIQLQKKNRIISISHTGFFTLKDTINEVQDTLKKSYILQEDTTLLEEIVVFSNKSSFYKKIFTEALEKLVKSMNTNYAYQYSIKNFIKNNAGYTNIFEGDIYIYPYKIDAKKDDKRLIFSYPKNINIELLHSQKSIKKDEFKGEDCANYCPLINNSEGLFSFVRLPILSYILSLKQLIIILNSPYYGFEGEENINEETYIIRFFYIKKNKRKVRSNIKGKIIVNKNDLRINKITYDIVFYPRNKIIGVLRRKPIPFPIFLKTKKSLQKFECTLNYENGYPVFKSVLLNHELVFKNKYKENENLFMIHDAGWEIKRVINEKPIKKKVGKRIFNYLDFYK